jgi:photosystem I subunit 10
MLTQSASFTSTPAVALAARPTARAAPVRVGARADGAFIGSATNIIMVTSTGLVLAAGRFGLAPSSRRLASASVTPLLRDRLRGSVDSR